jgi:5-formyltetrahydrofolate cyclo-ligase
MNKSKSDIRKQIKSLVRKLSAEQRRCEAERLLRLIAEEPNFQSAQRVLIYNPLPDEIDVLPILHKYKAQKQFFMPVVADDNTLKILPYTDEQKTGAYGIGEPVGTEFIDISTIDLVIVPGVGFTADGYRLGRGKGYYDRLLSGAKTYKIGVCYTCQIEPGIVETVEPHDVKMDKML